MILLPMKDRFGKFSEWILMAIFITCLRKALVVLTQNGENVYPVATCLFHVLIPIPS